MLQSRRDLTFTPHAGIAAKVLKSLGVNLKDARVEVEKIIGRGSGFVAVEIPFTPRAKRVLEMSLDEARQLGKMGGGEGNSRDSSFFHLQIEALLETVFSLETCRTQLHWH